MGFQKMACICCRFAAPVILGHTRLILYVNIHIYLIVFIVNTLFIFFFTTLPAFLRAILLILDKLPSPKGIVRSAQDPTDQQLPAAACVTG